MTDQDIIHDLQYALEVIEWELKQAKHLIKRIQDALGTEEEGNDLVEVAQNAHIAEMRLAAYEYSKDRR